MRKNPTMHVLTVNGVERCGVEVAGSFGARLQGLLRRDGVSGAMLIKPAASVHTFGMRFAIDVAHLGADLEVLRCTTMVPNRQGRLVWGAKAVLEAEAGQFAAWGVAPGAALALSERIGLIAS